MNARLLSIMLATASFGIAQRQLFLFRGQSQASFGGALARAGDLDRDGYGDLLIGAPWHGGEFDRNGAVFAVSGRDGRTLVRAVGARTESLGTSVAGLPDINADGHDDFVASASGSRNSGAGFARVYSGRDGSTLFTLRGLPGREFGWSVACAGDVDKDGRADVIVSGVETWPLAGHAIVFSGRDGRRLHVIDRPAATDKFFGEAVTGLGDLDSDGHDDFAVKWAYGAFMYSGKTGQTIHAIRHTEALRWVSRIHGGFDIDNDGINDLLISRPWANRGLLLEAGLLEIRSGKTWKLLHSLWGSAKCDNFGSAARLIQDYDGDGHDDFILSTHRGAPSGATVRVLSGKTANTINEWTGQQHASGFGANSARLPDLDDDGIPEVAVTTLVSNGFVQILSGRDLLLEGEASRASLSNGATVPLAIHGGRRLATHPYLVLGSHTGKRPGFRVGALRVPLNPDPYLLLLLQHPNGFVRASRGVLDAAGRGLAVLQLPPRSPSALRGLALHHACLVLDTTTLAPRTASRATTLLLVR